MSLPKPLLAAAFAALVVCAGASSARADTYSDKVCPRAVPKVLAFNDAATSKDLRRISNAARAAADAYKVCEFEAVVRTWEEPYVNYDRTRAAQFMVVEGRSQAALGETDAAIATLRDARALAEQVVAWLPLSQVYTQSSRAAVGNAADRNTDRKPSRYHDAALEIRAAADDALEVLATRRQQTIPTPAPQSSPKPA
jgi:hypothetical protein